MSSAHQSRPDPHQPSHEDPTTPGMSSPTARRRARFLLPGVFVLGIVVVFLIIVLVGNLA